MELDHLTMQLLYDNKDLLFDGVLERLNTETPAIQTTTLSILLLCINKSIESNMKNVDILIKTCVDFKNVVKWVIKYCLKNNPVTLVSMNYILSRLAFINNEDEVKSTPSLWELETKYEKAEIKSN